MIMTQQFREVLWVRKNCKILSLIWIPWIFKFVHTWFDSQVLQIIIIIEFLMATVSE